MTEATILPLGLMSVPSVRFVATRGPGRLMASPALEADPVQEHARGPLARLGPIGFGPIYGFASSTSAGGPLVIRIVASAMAIVGGAVWVLVSIWERPGRRATLRAPVRASRPGRAAFYASMISPLIFPIVVAVAPAWAYEGWANWSVRFDPALRAAGCVVWGIGIAGVLWSSRALGRYLSIDGVATDHRLVTRGPYRYVRHPFYVSFMGIAVGAALVFRSWFLVIAAGVWGLSSARAASAEEELLASPRGLGATYRAYVDATGRFLPKLRRSRERSTGAFAEPPDGGDQGC